MSIIVNIHYNVITENSNCFEILLHYSGGSGLTGSTITGVDYIDFVEKTYAYENIFDANHNTLHATLRMVFQFTFSQSLQSIFNSDTNYSTLSLFSESIFMNNLI